MMLGDMFMNLMSDKRMLARMIIPMLAFMISLAFSVVLVATAQDEANNVDIGTLKSQLSQSRQKAGDIDSSDNAELQKEFQKLLTRESEILSQMMKATPAPSKTEAPPQNQNKPSSLPSNTKASANVDRALDTLTEPSANGGAGTLAVKKNGEKSLVPPASTQRKQEANELDDLKMVEPADLQLQERIEGQGETIEKYKSQSADLQRQLDTARKNSRELSKELEETRNRLIIAETQVERLSSVIEERNRTNLSRYSPPVKKQTTSVQTPSKTYQAPRPANNQRQPAQQNQQPQAEKASDEMPVATVISDKAHLRTGPGKDNSPLMTVSRGTRLAVETRSGEWFRVISPTGARAWVSSDVLSFGGSPAGGNQANAVRPGGISPSLENDYTDLSSPANQ